MNIKEMSIVELKAVAYDIFIHTQSLQNDLIVVNQEIANRQNILKLKDVKEEER